MSDNDAIDTVDEATASAVGELPLDGSEGEELPSGPDEESPTDLILTPPEAALVRAAAGGDYCNFQPDAPEEDRTIRAAVLRALLVGARPDWKVGMSRIGVTSAVITGDLDLIHILRRDDRDAPPHALYARDCVFLKPLFFAHGAIGSLELEQCSLPDIFGIGLTAYGLVSIKECEIKGRIDLESADLRKSLDLSNSVVGADISLLGARVARDVALNGIGAGSSDRPSAVAVSLNGAEIEGAVFIRATGWGERTRHPEVVGELNAFGARIPGGIHMSGGRYRNPLGRALNFGGSTLGPVTFVERGRPELRFEVEGAVSFASAQINGLLTMRGGVLSPGASSSDAPEPVERPVCLDLERTTITGRLLLQDLRAPDGGRPKGAFILTAADVGELMDDPETAWPTPGDLELLGFTYRAIDFRLSGKGDRSDQRLAWLKLQQPRTRGASRVFRPQPYEQLAAVLRRMGYDEDADDVAIAKRRHREECRVDRFTSRFVSRFIGLTSRYGYSPGRAVASTALVILLGAALIGLLLGAGGIVFIPAELALLSEAPPTTYVAGIPKVWLSQLGWENHAALSSLAGPAIATTQHGCPALVVPVYALDMAVPVLDLGQESACRLETRGWSGGWLQAGRALYQVLGAIMTAVLITTLTGHLRKE